MNLFPRAAEKFFVLGFALFFLLLADAAAQTQTGSLRGQVVDPSGAAVAGATVLVLPAQGATITTTTNRDGSYEAKTLIPGKYTVQVFATGFATGVSVTVRVTTTDRSITRSTGVCTTIWPSLSKSPSRTSLPSADISFPSLPSGESDGFGRGACRFLMPPGTPRP